MVPPSSKYDASTGIYKSQIELPPLPEHSVYEHLLGGYSFSSDSTAFVEHHRRELELNGPRPKSITHGQLKLQAQRLGAGLLARGGLKPGDVVMILGPNSIEWVIVMLAAQFAGLVNALASPAYAAKELRHVYSLAQPKCVFLPTKLLIQSTRARIPWASLVTYDVNAGMPEVGFIGNLMVDEAQAKEAKPYRPVDLQQTASLPFSSGTTGLPKGVEITHRNIVAMIEIIRAGSDLYSQAQRLLTCLPFFHAMAFLMHVCTPITVGGTVHIQVPFDPSLFLTLVKKEQIQQLSVVPPILVLFGQIPQATQDVFETVISIGCGAAPLGADTQNRIAEKIGCNVVQGWGMTETTVGALGLHRNTTPGTCGRILPGIEGKLVDPETGKAVSPGERGELWVRGPNIMKGYYRNDAATKDTKTPDGWLKTGDVATVSDDGDFRVVDRIKELIKYKGNQIAPAELEALLLAHPKIASAGVVGIYDARQETEIPRAYVQLKPGTKAQGTEDDIQQYVRQRAGHAKWLRGGVRVVPQLPVTPSGKILRKELRLMLKAEEGAEAKSKL